MLRLTCIVCLVWNRCGEKSEGLECAVFLFSTAQLELSKNWECVGPSKLRIWHVNKVGVTDRDNIVLGKGFPLQAWSSPEGSRKLRFPYFMTTAQEVGKVVSLTHRPHLPPGNIPGTHFCWRLSRPQGHSAIGRIMSMKNSNDTVWDRTSDLSICSTAP